ncbi:MAG: hypothetical protein HUJ61_05740 [Bacilli bacterium]|nr:hypothetical protein [Bacilli bacterium]
MSCPSDSIKEEQENTNIIYTHNYDYEEVKEFALNSIEQIFDVGKEHYYVYFYMKTCGHCNQIKNEMISFGLERRDIYYIEKYEGIPSSNNDHSLIGATTPNEIFVKAYPFLIEILNGQVINTYLGVSQIKSSLNF